MHGFDLDTALLAPPFLQAILLEQTERSQLLSLRDGHAPRQHERQIPAELRQTPAYYGRAAGCLLVNCLTLYTERPVALSLAGGEAYLPIDCSLSRLDILLVRKDPNRYEDFPLLATFFLSGL